MTLAEAKDWVLVISGSITMLSIAVGIWLSLREYRLKLKAESRLERSSEIETEIRLLTLFTTLMQTANGRSGYHVSEKAVEFLLANAGAGGGRVDADALSQAVTRFATLTLPVGSAAQDAAVAAIASLTIKHPMLRDAGMRALQSLVEPLISPAAAYYHEKVQTHLKAEGFKP